MAVTLLLLIGVPAVGKTWTANKIMVETTLTQRYQFLHVNFDSLIPQKDYQSLSPLQWKIDRLELFEEVKNFLTELLRKNETFWRGDSVDLAEKDRLVVLIDDNMYYRSMRRRYYQLAQTLNCGFCQLYLKADLDQAMEVNVTRDGIARVSDLTIRKMFDNMDPPKSSIHWERNTLSIRAFSQLPSYLPGLTALLESCFMCPESLPERPITPVQAQPSVLQNVDLVLRKFVGQVVRECKGVFSQEDFKEFIQKISQHKSEFFDCVKTGKIEIAFDTSDSLVVDEFVLLACETLKHHPRYKVST